MGPSWGRQDPSGPHVGPMNFAIWDCMIAVFQNSTSAWLTITNAYILELTWVFSRATGCYGDIKDRRIVIKYITLRCCSNTFTCQVFHWPRGWPVLVFQIASIGVFQSEGLTVLISWEPCYQEHSSGKKCPTNFSWTCLTYTVAFCWEDLGSKTVVKAIKRCITVLNIGDGLMHVGFIARACTKHKTNCRVKHSHLKYCLNEIQKI